MVYCCLDIRIIVPLSDRCCQIAGIGFSAPDVPVEHIRYHADGISGSSEINSYVTVASTMRLFRRSGILVE